MSSRADLLPADTLLHLVVAMGNAIGPWVAVAFAAGAVQHEPRRGAAGGAIALCAGVATYYVAATLTWGQGVPTFLPQIAAAWLVVAALSGGAMGAGGGAWSADRYRLPGPTLLAGALLAEAAYRFIEVEGWRGIDLARSGVQVALIDVLAAAFLPAILVERARWPAADLGSLASGAVGLVLIVVVESLIRSIVAG